ncbi:MAG: hypothetical protein MJ211_05015 [Bacteroidales bacterium]|nr:hypothetical protein [Bacteroidales bacterium]
MKLKLIIVSALMAVCSSVMAQEDNEMRTLFNKGEAKWGGEITFLGGYSNFDERGYGEFGCEIGAIRNHTLELGLWGQGTISEAFTDKNFDEKCLFGGGFGGVFIKPIIMPESPIHFSIPIRIGGGCIGYYNSDYFWDDDWDRYHHYRYDEDIDECAIFVFQPGVNVDFKLLKHFQMSLGVSYRMYGSLDLYYPNGDVIAKKQDLNGLIYSVNFSFGMF